MKKRITYIGAVSAVAALVIAGCAGSPTKDGGTQSGAVGGNAGQALTFRSWSPIDQTTKKMIEVFQDENPEYTVESTILNGPDYWVDLQTRAGSDTFPDVLGLDPGANTQRYREQLLPLQDCAAETWGDDWQDMFHPIGLEQARLGNPEGDDNFYMLPLLIQSLNMWGNTQILDEFGVQPPATWDDLKAAVDELSGHSFTPFLMPAKDGWIRTSTYMQIANNISPGIVQKAEAGEVPWTDAALVEAFQYWGDIFTEGIAQDGAMSLDAYPTGVNQFEAGNAAMMPIGAWWIQQSDPTKDQSTIPELSKGMEGYIPFLFPTIPGGAAEAQIVGGIDVGLGISKNSKNPEGACKMLTEFIAGGPAQVLVNTLNDLPAVTGIEPQEFTSAKQEEVWGILTSWMPDVKWSRYFAEPKIDQAFQDATAAVATGQMTPEEAAQSVQDVADSM